MTSDLRNEIFASLAGKRFTARIRMSESGLVCGLDAAREKLADLGLKVLASLHDGEEATPETEILVFQGTAQAVAMAEDCVIGCIAKYSGIARAARKASELSGDLVRVVCGASKKIPEEIKAKARQALHAGGCGCRIVEEPFLYLDKNYVRMFGSVRKTLEGVAHMPGYTLVIQLRGLVQPLEQEVEDALKCGAHVLMVDTGRVEDLELVSRLVREAGARQRVSIAYSGDITLDEIPKLAALDVDILGVGRAVIDAPMADLKMDVENALAAEALPWKTTGEMPVPEAVGPEYHLLEKTELRIDGITLEGANLNDIACVVAKTLELPADKVLVIDVRLGQVSLDILMRTLRPEQFFGRKARLLEALAQVPGVRLDAEVDIHSEGILVSIGLEEEQAAQVIASSRSMGQAIISATKARVRIYPTGFELISGDIEDTNTPYLIKVFSEAGYLPEAGPAVPDNQSALADALRRAAVDCGVVVTTGGVGAEDKDFSVEAILQLDPQAATPYLARFAKGHGRHVKDGVRIGVGSYGGSLMVALPGPNDEVRLAAPVLIRGIKQKLSKQELAQSLAEILRGKWSSMEHAHTCCGKPHGSSHL